MEVSKEQIELWMKMLDNLNDTLDGLQEQIEFADEDKISADEYNEINAQIDKTINKITAMQIKIERELVERSLTDEKAKAFVDEEKDDVKNKIDEKQTEIDELTEIDEKLKENENMQLVNNLIQEKFDIQDKNRELETEKDALQASIEALDDQLTNLQAEIDDPAISKEDKAKKLQDKVQILRNKTGVKSKLSALNQKINENNQAIMDIDNELAEYGVPNTLESEIDAYYGSSGSPYSMDEKLIAVMDINNQGISNNRMDIRQDAKDKLGMKARFIKDDEIKAVLAEKLGQKRDEISRLEERGAGFNEADLIRKVKSDLEANSTSITKPQELEDIVSKVVNERKAMLNPARPLPSDSSERTSGGGSGGGTRVVSNLPIPVTSKSKNKVGFFKNIYETMISREFKEKRLGLAQEMYPELSEKQIKKYIGDHTDILNNMIRNDVTIDDIQEAKLVQQAQRKERMSKNKNNDFITKLRDTIRTGGDLDRFTKDQVDEKAKKAKESLKNDRDDR